MKVKRNTENERLTVRIDEATKEDMIKFADKNNISLAWIVRRSWIEFKEAVKTGKIKLQLFLFQLSCIVIKKAAIVILIRVIMKAISYVRVSTEDQSVNGVSLAAQQQKMRLRNR